MRFRASAAWARMTSLEHFRLAIVGAGPSGPAGAEFAARLGVSAALIESRRQRPDVRDPSQAAEMGCVLGGHYPRRRPEKLSVSTIRSYRLCPVDWISGR